MFYFVENIEQVTLSLRPLRLLVTFYLLLEYLKYVENNDNVYK